MTTTSTTTLTERYVQAMLREVPEGRRADLADELRSTIDDMIEGRVAAGEPADAAERATLTELGDPAALASRYTGARLHLIGPRFFLTWKRLTLQLLTWVPAVVATVVAAIRVLDHHESTVGQVIVDAGGAAITTAVQIAFWTTLVFAVLERVDADEPTPWTPDDLPEGVGERDPSFVDTVGSIAWNLVVAAALVIQHFRSWVEGPDGDDVAILDPDLWSGWLPFLLLTIAAFVALEVWKYRRGWTAGVAAGTVVTSVALSAPVAWLAMEDRLINPTFVDMVDLGSAGQDRLALAIAMGAALVAVWESAEAVVKWWRTHQGPS